MNPISFAVELHKIGPLGYSADVIDVDPEGRDGGVLFSTRIYECPEYAACMAWLWIDENS